MKSPQINVLCSMLFLLSLGIGRAEAVSARELPPVVDERVNGADLREEKMESRRGRDPFLLPQGVHNLTAAPRGLSSKPDDKLKMISSPSLEVKAILIGDRLRWAFIDHQIVTVGDQIHDERVLEIQSDRVVLAKGDKKRSLLLRQSPVQLTIEEGKRKGDNR
jgi:hypothetical protein